ncbi:unnamed protein product [Caenorhabditis sp. 36 PRJEB53466]|nr:unnamed protein product [Caenorhabditis sp. 36 PRJEB53466]
MAPTKKVVSTASSNKVLAKPMKAKKTDELTCGLGGGYWTEPAAGTRRTRLVPAKFLDAAEPPKRKPSKSTGEKRRIAAPSEPTPSTSAAPAPSAVDALGTFLASLTEERREALIREFAEGMQRRHQERMARYA